MKKRNPKKLSKYILDTYAILAFLEQEQGYENVEALFRKAENKEIELFIPMINFGELIYILFRERGESETVKLITKIKNLPIIILEIKEDLTWEAAKIKAKGGLSFADSFIIAAAVLHDATIVTGEQEFKKFDKLARFIWL